MYLSLNAHALHEQLQSEKWNVVTQFTWVTTLRFSGTASCVLRSRSTASFAMNIAVVFHLDIFLLFAGTAHVARSFLLATCDVPAVANKCPSCDHRGVPSIIT
jgi:hypothetical protein